MSMNPAGQEAVVQAPLLIEAPLGNRLQPLVLMPE